jgi:hypothetical protein
MLIQCSCTPLSKSEPLEQKSVSLTGRLFDIHFDDSAPVNVRIEQTGLLDNKKTYRVRIEYVERANRSGDIAEIPSTFLNVYFLACGSADEGSFVAHSTQLVIDIWEHDPEVSSKICYQWLLNDENVDDRVDKVLAESFTENRWNIVQEIQEIPTPGKELEEYSRLYRRCVGYMLKRMGFTSTDEFFKNLS